MRQAGALVAVSYQQLRRNVLLPVQLHCVANQGNKYRCGVVGPKQGPINVRTCPLAVGQVPHLGQDLLGQARALEEAADSTAAAHSMCGSIASAGMARRCCCFGQAC